MTGTNGGIIVLVADDPSMHSSQNEQDSRFYAKFAMIPCFEPSSQQEAYDMVHYAFDYSERIHLPILMRVTTRMAHSRAVVEIRENPREQNAINFDAKSSEWVLLPAMARRRNDIVTSQQTELEKDTVESRFNVYTDGDNHSLGIITGGIGINYLFNLIYNACMNLMSVFIVYSVGFNSAKIFGHEELAFNNGFLAEVAFFILMPIGSYTAEGAFGATNFYAIDYLGSHGVFLALITGIVVTKINIFIVEKKITIKMPAGVPQNVSDSFTILYFLPT